MTIRTGTISALTGGIVIAMASVHTGVARSYSNAIHSAEEIIGESPKAGRLDALSTISVQASAEALNPDRPSASDILSHLSSELRLVDASQCSINTYSPFGSGPYRVTKIKMQFMAGFDAVHDLLKRIGAPYYQPSRIESIHLVRSVDGSKHLDVTIMLSVYEREEYGTD